MDIKTKFRQALAGAATVALLASNAGIALAGTWFDDVNATDWFQPYVDQLAEDGVVDTGPANKMFRPNDAGNRAELVKMAVEVAGLLDGFELPVQPTFKDVPTNAWFFKYVEAAAANGIVGGYTDANGPTGYFGPGDNMTRDAAAKVIANTFQLTNDGASALPFTDVPTSHWSYPSVQSVWAWSVVDGKTPTMYDPGANVTRAEWSKMLVKAQTPVWRGGVNPPACGATEYLDKTTDPATCKPILTCEAGQFFNTDTGMCEPMTTSEGDLNVSLNATTPMGTNLPLGAQNVELFEFDLKAVGDDVQVNQLLITRLGVGDVTDWAAVYLYEGDMRMTSERTFASDTNQAIFPIKNFVIPAGQTRMLTLVGNVSPTAAPGSAHSFSVVASADVTTNAQAVTGTFPVSGPMGQPFLISGVSVGSATFSAVTISQPTIGEKDAEVGAFKLAASGANDIALERITLTQNGSFDPADFSACRLLAGSDEVATADSFMGETVTFVLGTPFQLDSGQNRTFYVRCDVNGGKTTETVQLYLDFEADAKVMDLQYGFGAQVINSTLTIAGVTAVTLAGGDLVLIDNSAPSTQIAVNSTNQMITEFGVTAARDLLVRDTDVMIELKDINNVGPDLSGTLGTAKTVAGVQAAFDTITGQTGGNVTYTADALGDTGITVEVVVGSSDNGGAGGGAANIVIDVVGTAITATIDNDTNAGNEEDVSEIGLINCLNSAASVVVAGTDDVNAGDGNVACVINDDASALITAAGGDAADIAITEGALVLAGGAEGTLNDTSNFCVNTVAGTFTVGDAIQVTAASGTVNALLTGIAAAEVATCGAAAFVLETSLASGDAVAAGGDVTEVNPYSYLKNVKLMDVDTSSTLAGPLTLASQGTASAGANTTYTKTFTEDYDLIGGQTRNLAVVLDVDQLMPADYRVRATVTYGASYVKDADANEFVALEDIVGSPLAGNFMTIADNTLVVARSSSPISQEYVLGQQGVNVLGLSLQAGDAGDVKVRKLIVRAYGDDGGTEFNDANGDASANLLVSSVSLYNGDTLVAGPKGFSATGTDPNDFDIATFDQLDLMVPKGQTLNLTVKANLLNTKNGMIAFDVVPSTDLTAEDVDNNTLALSSTAINAYDTNHFAVEHEVITTGTLTASENGGSPLQDIVVAGVQEKLVATYDFQAVDEAFDVNKLTVINDLSGAFDTAESTNAVESVTIKYPNAEGVMQTRTVDMTSGSANFSGLDFIVPKNSEATVEIYANVAPMSVSSISGLNFRLGLKDTANTINTFEAVGLASSNTITSGMSITQGANVSSFTVRKTVPSFTQTNVLGALNNNTELELYDVKVTADAAGSVHVARMVFDVTPNFNTPAGADLFDFNVYRDGAKLPATDVNIFCGAIDLLDDAGGALDATTLEVCDAGGNNDTLANQTYKVIVSFNKQQTISSNSPVTYALKATAQGVVAADDDSVSTRLATGDEIVALSGLTAVGNANTGQVYVSNDATAGIFSANGDGTGLSLLLGTARNFIWSDGSATPHDFPVVTDGTVDTATGSADWTNGYQLEIDSLLSKGLNS